MEASVSKLVLPVIVSSQFCCTSLWFAGNAVMDDLLSDFNLSVSATGYLTSSVQLGFIIGTLVFAILTLADRFSPALLFLVSAALGALFNLGVMLEVNTLGSLVLFRGLTGFALAGIYPVGMKIASDYYESGLGKSLGYLVGALVLGTAFPHLVNVFSGDLPWRAVILITSGIALMGGLLMWFFVGDGPYRKKMSEPDFRVLFKVFHNRGFRSAAFGYFGHMWELYAFWAFVPFLLRAYREMHGIPQLDIAFWSFIVIGCGAVSCVLGGYLSTYIGSRGTAFYALTLSGLCCMLSPFVIFQSSLWIFITFLIFWGLVVIADSPQFSTLVAKHADPQNKGTALTISNCIGFGITIVSIQLLSYLSGNISPAFLFLFLLPGPVFGLTSILLIRE